MTNKRIPMTEPKKDLKPVELEYYYCRDCGDDIPPGNRDYCLDCDPCRYTGEKDDDTD